MEGMGLKFTPVVVRRLLGSSKHVRYYGWHILDSKLVQIILMEGLTCLRLPTLSQHPPHPLL